MWLSDPENYEAQYTNGNGELLTIQRATGGPWEGEPLLVVHDDPPSAVTAPLMIDRGMIDWLREQCDRLEAEL